MKRIDIETIKELSASGRIQWTSHALVRIFQRNIPQKDIKKALADGEIIEQYEEDYPYPSCIVLGPKRGANNLHVVCGIGDEKLWIITAYKPDREIWDESLKQRRDR
jgi:hypothetical protein